jgi:DNA topoisomerase-1
VGLADVIRVRAPRSRTAAIVTDSEGSARSAGLRYVSDSRPGIRRRIGRLGFEYLDPRGRRIRHSRELKRIAALAVPPAWTDVWICPDARGHLQATGRDVKGRKQYRYHSGWRACRDETKFDRMQAFAAALPAIRARTSADLRRAGLTREKVLATVVQLLEKSLIRVGNDEYAKQNRSFGLTTLRDDHVKVKGHALRFTFRGKSGIRHTIDVNDARLARIVKQCRDLPGQELFQYVDDEGRRQDVTSTDVNAYLREITGEDFTAKDFRTWAGTVLAATALFDVEAAASQTQTKRRLLPVIDAVAGVLGNTRAVCRKSYIHPIVIDTFMAGALSGYATRRRALRGVTAGLRPDEMAVLALLKQKAPKVPPARHRERRRAA